MQSFPSSKHTAQGHQKHGIVLEHAQAGKREVVTVPVIENLHENDALDVPITPA